MSKHTIPNAPLALLKSGFCAVVIALAGALIGGCGSGPGGGSSSSAPSSSEAKINGIVQDQHGPIMNAKIEVRDNMGQVVASTELGGDSNKYTITVPAGAAYPIVLTATPPAGSNSATVKAVVTSSLADRIDITDVSTIVVESAMSLGGLTAENIAKASGSAIGLRQRQGVSAAAGGGGGGAGQSGGGAGRGGHGGHDMSGMGGGGSPQGGGQPGSMEGMQH